MLPIVAPLIDDIRVVIYAKARIIIYSLIVLATVIKSVNYDRTVIMIINYDCKTFIVQATGLGSQTEDLKNADFFPTLKLFAINAIKLFFSVTIP
jgi:hypothetical protein